MKKILWGWNGTLLDDVTAGFSCMVRTQKKYGITPLKSVDQYRQIFGFPVKGYYEKAGFDFDQLDWNQVGQDFMNDYISCFQDIPLNAQAIEVLKKAKADGAMNLILSATRLDLLKEQVMKFPQLKDLIDGVYGIEDIYASSKVGAGQEILKNSLPWDELVMIGDTLHDAQVASALKIPVILCETGHQSRQILDAAGVPVVSSLEEALKQVGSE